jgi:Arc/MetJ family transcription regulator
MTQTMHVTGETTKKGAVEAAMRLAVRNDRLRQAITNLAGIGWDAPPSEDRQFDEDGTPYYPSDRA